MDAVLTRSSTLVLKLVLAGGGEGAPGTLDDNLRGPVPGVDTLGDVLAPHQLGKEAPNERVTGTYIYISKRQQNRTKNVGQSDA